jgi:hypothetical protein
LKTSPKRSFSIIEIERLFVKTAWVYKFGHSIGTKDIRMWLFFCIDHFCKHILNSSAIAGCVLFCLYSLKENAQVLVV